MKSEKTVCFKIMNKREVFVFTKKKDEKLYGKLAR